MRAGEERWEGFHELVFRLQRMRAGSPLTQASQHGPFAGN